MQIIEPAGGRFVPASQLDFSRYAKNFAWLLEIKLHEARELLAGVYGYGSEHELRQVMLNPSAKGGPFEAPQARPQFPDGMDTEFSTLTGFRARLAGALLDRIFKGAGVLGRTRRRVFAAFDAGFFCDPKNHRRQFDHVKEGIVALEGSDEAMEAYLESHWPPAFWSFIEITHFAPDLLPMDSSGLAKLDHESFYDYGFDVTPATPQTLRQAMASVRAPEVYLAMVPSARTDSTELEPKIIYDEQPEPSLTGTGLGLYEPEWDESLDDLVEAAAAALGLEVDDFPEDKAYLDTILERASDLPGNLARAARQWHFNGLRSACERFVSDEYRGRQFLVRSEIAWKERSEEDPEQPPQEDWEQRWLSMSCHFEQTNRGDTDGTSMEIWSFKGILTDDARSRTSRIVGELKGHFLVLSSERYAVSDRDFRYACQGSAPLEDLARAFADGYLRLQGHGDLLEYVNSQINHAIVGIEMQLLPEYRGKGLAARALSLFSTLGLAHQRQELSDPWAWRLLCDFELDTDDVTMAGFDMVPEDEAELGWPGVFFLPVARENRRLSSHLRRLKVEVEDMDLEVDVVPYVPVV